MKSIFNPILQTLTILSILFITSCTFVSETSNTFTSGEETNLTIRINPEETLSKNSLNKSAWNKVVLHEAINYL